MKKRVGQLEVYSSNNKTPTGPLRFRLSPEFKSSMKITISRTGELR